MPLAFLVKRKKHNNVYKTYRARHNSDDDRSDSGSEQENLYVSQPYGSPDSGYSHSPVSLTFKDPGARILLTCNDGATDLRTGRNKRLEDNSSGAHVVKIESHVDLASYGTTKGTHNPEEEKSNIVPKQLPGMGMKLPLTGRFDSHLLSHGVNNNSEYFPSQVTFPQHQRFAHENVLEKQVQHRAVEEERMVVDTTRPESTCSSSSRSSPVSRVDTPTPQGSPFYFTNFDRLSVSSPNSKASSTSPFPIAIPAPPTSTVTVATKPTSTPGTPASPCKKRSATSQDPNGSKPKTPKKSKAIRKIKFELEDKSSPVSGTFIRDEDDMDTVGGTVVCGDIDSSLNMVEITPEARQELEKIENKIGDYICQLCKEFYSDAFLLAQHKCSRIVHIEYRCPECDKVFNCPANLASHRRWHKPRPNGNSKGSSNNNNNNKTDCNKSSSMDMNGQKPVEGQTVLEGGLHRQSPSPGAESGDGLFECDQCGKKFKRQAYLKKHMASHGDEKPYPCQFCGKVLRSETARAKHVLQHAVGGNKDLSCEVCGNSFPNKPALERHSRLHNSEVYTCKYCSSTFYSSPGLTRHINKCHPSENRQVILLQMPVNRTC